MKPPVNRRTLLTATGFVAIVVVAGTVLAQPRDMHGAVTFESGKVIPKGNIDIYLDDPSLQDKTRHRQAETRVKSDGASQTISFSLTLPASLTTSSTLQIVARLQRYDGWLLARGSAQVEDGLPVSITLNTAMY